MDLKQTILELVQRRGPSGSICPSEAARRACPEGWRSLMPAVRGAAAELAREGRLVVLQRGGEVDPDEARGPIRLRIKAARPRDDGS